LWVIAKDKASGQEVSVSYENLYQGSKQKSTIREWQEATGSASFPKASSSQNKADYDAEMPLVLTSVEMNQGVQKEVELKDRKKITFKVPAGVKNGQKIRLKGQGKFNSSQERGDLFLIIREQTEQSDIQNKISVAGGVTTESLGVETLGGIMTVIIPKNTSLPAKVGEVFSTAVDGQNSVEINVLKGNNELGKDNVSLGTFCVNEIPSAPKGVPQIEISFAIDSNGVLSVSARDQGTGKEASVTVQTT